MQRETAFHIWYVIAAILAVLFLQYLISMGTQVESIPYSQFEAYLHDGNIAEVVVSDHALSGKFKEALPDGRSRFQTDRVDPAFANELAKYNVTVTGTPDTGFVRDLLSWIVPALFFLAIWVFVFRRMAAGGGMGGGLMSIGRSNAKVYVETDTKVTFADVAGVDEAKDDLKEIVAFLKNPEQYGRLGARIPKGVLLVGPPGTGKTLLARAVAGEAGVPFFSINGSEFVEMFVGVGAARVRDLFEQARAKAPAIIFIDELDALGRARGAFPGIGGHDEKEQTLNQLLSELDGFDSRSGLVLLAATNRPEILDPALLRAGRFDRQVLVDRPDRKGRAQIAAIYLKRIRCAADVTAEGVAELTPGFTGADIANLVNEAALVATRADAADVTMAHFTAAVERIVAGLEKRNRILNPHEREAVAFHEMGHALVAMSLPGSDIVHKVSIIPRGIGALGYTIQRPTEDRYLMTREELANKMAVLLGGRAAERLVFGELSTGAADDLAKVTDIARSIVMQYGMEEKLGNVVYEKRSPFLGTPAEFHERDFSEETARTIDAAVQRITREAFDKASGILQDRRKTLERGARLLLERETLTERELNEIIASEPLQPLLPLQKGSNAASGVI
ncbi:MAG TPA: ATP-dependent zinc metalloprotease FtsH [Stellaceae bacterium]|nr:ATP-dependent zinc metalloprotease FtsH [Stellaceae bacterium]